MSAPQKRGSKAANRGSITRMLTDGKMEFSDTYDYAIVFPIVDNNQTPATKFVIGAMKEAGLETFNYLSVQRDELICLIRFPPDGVIMRKFADDINIKMELDPNMCMSILESGVKDPTDANKWKIAPVRITDDPKYSPYFPYDHIFGNYDSEKAERKLYNVAQGDTSPFTKQIRLKLLYYFMKASKRMGGCDLEFNKLIMKKKINCLFPMHDRDVTQQLLDKVFEYGTFPWSIPIHQFKEYFGEKIMLYNVFLGHYSHWLITPAVVGIICQLVVWGSGNYSSPVLPFYSVIICVWSIFMLEYWKREESSIALSWGMTEFERNEPDRPEFKGELIRSYINGAPTLYFAPGEESVRSNVSKGIVASFILLVVGVVSSIYVLRFALQHDIGSNASIVASVLNTIQIQIFNFIYQEVTVQLTDLENHRTDTAYEDSMILKLFSFQFVNSYSSFFFLAFVAANIRREGDDDDSRETQGQCGAANCMSPLMLNLAIIFGTRLTLTNFLDIFLPYMAAQAKFKKETEGVENAVDRLTPAEKDYMLMPYNSLIMGIQNYADTAIQYGFSMLFVAALPCASFFSLVSNYVKTKFNLWKLTDFYQRPIPTGAQDIGTWQSIFSFVSVAAVATNAGLVFFTMDAMPSYYSQYGKLWLFVGFNWVLILAMFAAQAVVTDVPEEVEIQLARMAFIHDNVILDVPDEDPSPVTGTEYTDLNKPPSDTAVDGDAPPSEPEKVCCLSACCVPKPVTGATRAPKMGKLGKQMADIALNEYPSGGNAMVSNPIFSQA